MMLTELASVLRSAGLSVVEQPGWKERGHGQMSAVRGVTIHHTASGRGTGTTLGLDTVQNGRGSELPGPLAQLYLNRAGVFYVVAAGLSYHAGRSRQADQTNGFRIGIEALAAGDGWSQDWPDVQVDAMARGSAALAQHYGVSAGQVLGHKETCFPAGRKIDPSFDMVKFRRLVSGYMNPPTIEKENPMELSDKVELTEVGADEMSVPGYTVRKAKDKISVGYLLLWGGPGVYRLLGKINSLRAAVDNYAVNTKSQHKALSDDVAELTTKVDQILAAVSQVK